MELLFFFENNQTTQKKSWVIETAGSFRSERLFILAQKFLQFQVKAFRILISQIVRTLSVTNKECSIKDFEKVINSDDFRIIGKKSSSGEWILQVKKFLLMH